MKESEINVMGGHEPRNWAASKSCRGEELDSSLGPPEIMQPC